jgi:hypothetical protein
MSRQHTGCIGLGVIGTLATALSQRGAGSFPHARSTPAQNITATARGAEIAQQADACLFMQCDIPNVGLKRADAAGMALTQRSSFQIGRQSSA